MSWDAWNAETIALRQRAEALQARVTELEAWKASALAVESEWAPQEVAKLLDLKLGTSIRAGIAPAIKQLQARVTELEGAYKFISDSLRQELLENAKLRAALDPAKIADAFTRWPLPDSVCADPCALKQGPGRTGTNLLSWAEARAMAEQVVLLLLNGEEPAPRARRSSLCGLS